jgi:hypothetical protein
VLLWGGDFQLPRDTINALQIHIPPTTRRFSYLWASHYSTIYTRLPRELQLHQGPRHYLTGSRRCSCGFLSVGEDTARSPVCYIRPWQMFLSFHRDVIPQRGGCESCWLTRHCSKVDGTGGKPLASKRFPPNERNRIAYIIGPPLSARLYYPPTLGFEHRERVDHYRRSGPWGSRMIVGWLQSLRYHDQHDPSDGTLLSVVTAADMLFQTIASNLVLFTSIMDNYRGRHLCLVLQQVDMKFQLRQLARSVVCR